MENKTPINSVDREALWRIYEELKKRVTNSPSLFAPHDFNEIEPLLKGGQFEGAIKRIIKVIGWLLSVHMIYGNVDTIEALDDFIRLIPKSQSNKNEGNDNGRF
jgi:hypothetical protein